MLESAAAPLTAFAIAPIAEFWIIPAFRNPETAESFQWLLGEGEARGIALIFLIAGSIIVGISIWALHSKTYRLLSKSYQTAKTATPNETV